MFRSVLIQFSNNVDDVELVKLLANKYYNFSMFLTIVWGRVNDNRIITHKIQFLFFFQILCFPF